MPTEDEPVLVRGRPRPIDSRATDGEVAAGLATAAGERLVALRRSGLGAADLRQAGDSTSHEFIVAELGRLFPDDRIRSEEAEANEEVALPPSPRLWIVDPLDGTREFSEPPRVDWSVHVALAVDGEPVAGAVALPARGLTLSTSPPPAKPAPWEGRPRVLVSRTRPPEFAVRLAESIGGDLLPMGSAGAKAMAVVLGEGDVYAHSGGQYEWDSAAPVAVARSAGLHVSRLDGSPLQYDRPDPWLPDLLICQPHLAQAVIAASSGST